MSQLKLKVKEIFLHLQSNPVLQWNGGPKFLTDTVGYSDIVFILLLSVVTVGSSSVFSYATYHETEDMFMTTEFGKTKLVLSKTIAGLIYACFVALIIIGLFYLFASLLYGFASDVYIIKHGKIQHFAFFSSIYVNALLVF